MGVAGWGALAFGAVVGWFIYYINRYRRGDVQISDVTTLIGAIGGAGVLVLFRKEGTDDGGLLFGAYGIGLALGFFSYYVVLVILVSKSPNFDADWFLDGRRVNPGEGIGYGDNQSRAMVESVAALPRTQIFNIGGPQGATQQSAFEAADTGLGQAGPSDDDPAMPAIDEVSETSNLEMGRVLANLGGGPIEDTAPAAAEAAAAVPAPLGINIARATQFLQDCMTSHPRVTYGLGAKVPFHGATPGTQFTKIDCSGFVREAIRLSTTPMLAFPDGSVVQHDWIRNRGFQKVAIGNGKLNDNRVRIAFLRPRDAPSGIGHVVLIHNGRTLESHGGVGPDTRVWTGTGWQAKACVYEVD